MATQEGEQVSRDADRTANNSHDNVVRNKVRNFFERTATSFDRLYGESPSIVRWVNRTVRRSLYERSRIALDEVRRLGNPTVLDIGTGSGVNALAMLEAGARFVLGLDFSESMLKLARDRAAEANVADQCQFISAEFMSWEIDQVFDLCTALGVLDYIAEGQAFVTKAMRLTRGSVVMSCPGRDFIRRPIRWARYAIRGCPLYFYDSDEVTAWVKAAGAAEVEIPFRDRSGFILVARRGQESR